MSNTINVYIEEQQLIAQKKNNYSLYLAKKVNDSFTVIWQSRGPVATVNSPAYEYSNVFSIATPAYIVNYTNDPVSSGSVTFQSSGRNAAIRTGQVITLDSNGVFSTAQNGGKAGDIVVINSLQGNPHEILRDEKGNNIWVNTESGMNVGTATLTPKYEYQLWFGNLQETGTLIADNRSNVETVTMEDGGSVTVTYTNAGIWEFGAPVNMLSKSAQKKLMEA